MKLELLTNVIDDAIRFTKGLQDRLTLSKKEDDKESNEPDYDEDRDQLEEEQEEETGELNEQESTTNNVF
jgi:hypothetical protein